MAIAAIALFVFVGGCGTDSAPSDLAAQDKAVQLGNQLAATHRRVVEAQRFVSQQRRSAIRLAALQPRPRTSSSASPPVGFSLDTLCRPVKARGNSRLARQVRKQRERVRRQALYSLNLSCTPTRS